MSDLIETWKNDFKAFVNSLNLSRDDYKTMMEYIDELPAIHPDHNADVSKKVEAKDCISRRAAIDAIEKAKMAQTPDGEIFVAKYNAEMNIQLLPSAQPEPHWIPCSERLPSKGEREEWINKNLGGIGYLYPCLVTRYSSISPDRTENNPYVAKHYFDGEDFVNNAEEVCSEYIIAWMPLPEPYMKEGDQ